MRRLEHFWRICATGAAFAFIFAGGGLLAGLSAPLLLLARHRRRRQVQSAIHAIFGLYLRSLQRLRIISLEFEGVERLRAGTGRLVIANHPSLLDVVMLMALVPDAQCIVKNELWRHPLLGPLMRSAGYIRNDLDPDRLIEACRTSLEKGQNLIIFPEGTRSTPGQAPRFRRGFANLATLTEVPIQLVLISCDPPTLIKGEPWWRVPADRPTFRLTATECLDAALYLNYPHRSIAARKLVHHLERYYAEKLGYV